MSRARSRSVICALALALAAASLAAPVFAAAPDDPVVTVYRRGKVLRFDPDVGADLKEVILEYWSAKTGSMARKETVEAYFHLSEDGEILTPEKLTKEFYQVFEIEKKGDRYFFRGPKEKRSSPEDVEGKKPASREEVIASLKEKIWKVCDSLNELDDKKLGAAQRARAIITAELTESLHDFPDGDLDKICDIIEEHPTLKQDRKYWVLTSFGWEFYMSQQFKGGLVFYQRAIRMKPDWAGARWEKGLVYEQLQRHDEAVRCFADALALKPKAKYANQLSTMLGKVERTERLGNAEVVELRQIVEDLKHAFGEGNEAKQREQVKRLQDRIGELYRDLK